MKMILSSAQIRQWDEFTIANEPISSVDLMERAAQAFVDAFTQHVEASRKIAIVCGPGNNGGDGFAIGRLLFEKGFSTTCYLIDFGSKLSEDCRLNYERYSNLGRVRIIKDIHDLKLESDLIIDALFGSGLNRPAMGLAADVIQKMNDFRKSIISVDIPSGLFADQVNLSGKVIRARWTITFQTPKLSFLIPESGMYVGDLTVVKIGLHTDFLMDQTSEYSLVEETDVSPSFFQRTKFEHKGNFGKILIVAGSKGKMGAAYLSSKACLKSGAGLLTVHIPQIGNAILQTLLPEAMVSLDEQMDFSTEIENTKGYDTIGIGPGLGTHPTTKALLKSLFTSFNKPMVIDADALNIIASERGMINSVPKGSVLTPHVGEFERLFGKFDNGLERISKMKEVAQEKDLVIVLKGANTAVAAPSGKVYFNSTGNAGMATAGCGDVLTGIITALLARGIEGEWAAIMAVYLHGWAGDVAEKTVGKTSFMASDLLHTLSEVISNVENKIFI